ncbi:hypothetical protein INO15_14240, partial [Staphylococcus aureus]|nr:hypothetical protein [Staphylococcus aureus]
SKAEWASLAEGSRDLIAGPETGWKWQNVEQNSETLEGVDHLALLTLVFPEIVSTDTAVAAPHAHAVQTPQNLSITALPATI